jgi:hypothetical protein
MQMPTTMQDAFDWTINTQDGVSLFFEKLALAENNARKMENTHPGLRDLTASELEDMAIELYGPFPGGLNLTKQYYAPSCVGGTANGNACSGGSWEWIVNIAGNNRGVGYVANVRKNIQLP